MRRQGAGSIRGACSASSVQGLWLCQSYNPGVLPGRGRCTGCIGPGILHLGELVDTRRFLPWVQRIVRNQAYTRLKGSSAMKEQTFTELEGRGRYDSAGSADQWNNLDSILGRLHHSSAKAAAGFNVPEERIVQQETLRVITDIIQRLKPRERLIFESHFSISCPRKKSLTCFSSLRPMCIRLFRDHGRK